MREQLTTQIMLGISSDELKANQKGPLHLPNSCRETLQVERALLRTLVERATERAFHPSHHLTPTSGAGNKASFATETS